MVWNEVTSHQSGHRKDVSDGSDCWHQPFLAASLQTSLRSQSVCSSPCRGQGTPKKAGTRLTS
ncbi:unnamed protein product [Gulo gulo]|uniref:Uncharacterized protein n=1 Tax=Gulo gulo TaxID=48420 RepID=A0A9X9LPQ7_GULGU|nr:unnamed protein product [Gulo gulo]